MLSCLLGWSSCCPTAAGAPCAGGGACLLCPQMQRVLEQKTSTCTHAVIGQHPTNALNTGCHPLLPVLLHPYPAAAGMHCHTPLLHDMPACHTKL